jgi:putative tricarboxylic transport membrane protein
MFDLPILNVFKVFTPSALPWLLSGVIIGLIVGVLPGLGITATLAILLPLVYTLHPSSALIFLVAIYAAGSQGGVITSILFGVPGETCSTASMLDGYPMTKQGKAGRALGVSQMASLMGAVFGGLVLAALIPVARPVILAFGSPELFMMAIVGVSFVAVLGRGSMLKSFIGGSLGLMLAYVGFHPATGTLRYTGDILYFWSGFQVVPVFMGLFAIPEVIDLAVRGGSIAKGGEANVGWRDIWLGIKDVLRHWWLVLRCSAIGTALGLVPGVGAAVSQFLCYGYAKQTSKTPQEFGLGCVEGIIAPEASNNAKEGGSLFTALAFGLPSGAAMVIILAALMVLDVKPGAEMITKQLPLFWTLVGCLIFGNVLSCGFCLLAGRALARITFVKGTILVPVIMLLVVLGAYGVANNINDVFMAFAFGGIGYLMKVYDYSRVTFTIGFVLGDYVERYFLISIASLGPGFLISSPIALGLLAVTVIFLTGRVGMGLSRRLIRHLMSKEEELE